MLYWVKPFPDWLNKRSLRLWEKEAELSPCGLRWYLLCHLTPELSRHAERARRWDNLSASAETAKRARLERIVRAHCKNPLYLECACTLYLQCHLGNEGRLDPLQRLREL